MTNAEVEINNKRRKSISTHINNVRQNCEKLGEALIEAGEVNLGHRLISNGYCHDQSKFHGVEWTYLHDDVKEKSPELFKAAMSQHITTNLHHPEAWEGGIHAMDRLHLAEFCCDIHARSSEFGTDLREWVKTVALKKYGFTVQSKPYKTVKYMLDLLLDPSF